MACPYFRSSGELSSPFSCDSAIVRMIFVVMKNIQQNVEALNEGRIPSKAVFCGVSVSAWLHNSVFQQSLGYRWWWLCSTLSLILVCSATLVDKLDVVFDWLLNSWLLIVEQPEADDVQCRFIVFSKHKKHLILKFVCDCRLTGFGLKFVLALLST